MSHYIGFCFPLLLFILPLVWTSNQPEVSIRQGVVRGLYKRSYIGNKPYSSFEGIPYARPPQGKKRFREPEPTKPWIGIYNATKEPPRCLQINIKIFNISETLDNQNEVVGSEDCLYINVYTPKLPNEGGNEKLLDVIAFIHGGGFIALHSTFHNADYLLEKDLVLVTFNYRLGPLGFLSTEDRIVPGNNGLKDQVLALKWIQENIAAFGGNPNSVTIAGISAGGASCHLHLLSPLSKGLFKGAICMSGVSLSPWVISRTSKEKAVVLADQLGCPTNDTKVMVKCLQKRPADHIVALTKYFWFTKASSIPFSPVVEPPGPNAFISKEPEDILLEKGASDVPLLLTYVPDEGLLFGARFLGKPETWDQAVSFLASFGYSVPPEKSSEISKKIKEHYKIDNSTQGGFNLLKMYGDSAFLLGIGKAAKLHASLYSSPVYVYQFSYRGQLSHSKTFSDENLGIIHCDDVIYIAGSALTGRFSSESDTQVAITMVDIWASFAANGSLGSDFESVSSHLPQLVYTDIEGPRYLKKVIVDGIGEEAFWDSLKASANNHEEL
ncbi:carboxylic ester hydrolase [Halyomorpha halys]|uniref:carboxylic ester hydrolase n=1 Tax=Halyomorpha halys TaxID=286706 RepID=UPI0006D4F5FB|nr:esterase FE4-like [Halyomorpha halys]